MIQLTPQSRIFLATEPVDFRNGIDGLATVCIGSAWATTRLRAPSTSFEIARAPHSNSCCTTAKVIGSV
jgi:hypothetical protein